MNHRFCILVASLALFLNGIARAELSLSDVTQHLDAMADADPLARKPSDGRRVTGTMLTNGLPQAGQFYRIAIQPGGGGYPGATLSFDHPLDFSKHDVLAIWFKADAPASYFQIVLNGADRVTVDYSLASAAAEGTSRVEPGVWHRAYIPYKAVMGWVRFGPRMDFSKIKSMTFYTWDDTLSRKRPIYEFAFGGAALLSTDEAKSAFPRTLQRPIPHTAARIAKTDDLLVWTADVGEKILRDTPLPRNAPRASAACAKVAGNEYASLLWVAKPSHDLADIHVALDDLVCGANRISATNITPRYVDYVPGVIQDSPDPLPLLNGKHLSAKAGENFQLWATIYVPSGTPKGTYRGFITLKDAGGLNQRLPVQVDVYGFSLSTMTHLKSLFTIQHLYGGPEWMKERSERYWGRRIEPFSKEYVTVLNNVIREFGRHRIAPDLCSSYYNFLSDDDRLALHRQYGFDPVFVVYMNLVNAYFGHESMSETERGQIIAMLRSAGEKRKNEGTADLSVIKIADEPQAEHMKAVLMAAHDAHAAIPYIQSFITITSAHLPESLYGLVDTWCPIWGVLDFEGQQVRERRAAGDHFWTYAAEYKSNDAYVPMDLRVPYWLYWKYGITGVHYSHDQHRVFLTYPNDSYPHSDGLEEIPSIRWEMIRHGVQDHEYLWMLNDLIAKSGKKGKKYRKLLEVPNELAASPLEYTTDPGVLQKQRDRIAVAIETLSRQ